MFNSDYFLLRTNTSSLICNVTPGISQMNGTFTSQCLPNGQAVLDKFYINKVNYFIKWSWLMIHQIILKGQF